MARHRIPIELAASVAQLNLLFSFARLTPSILVSSIFRVCYGWRGYKARSTHTSEKPS